MFFKKFLEKQKEKRAKKLREDFNERLLSLVSRIVTRIDDKCFNTVSRQQVIDKVFEHYRDEYTLDLANGNTIYKITQFAWCQTDSH